MRELGIEDAGALLRGGKLRGPFAVLVALGALCIFGVASARAPGSQFGTQGEAGGQFRTPIGVAVNQESGDVFLADNENNRVDQFGASGRFIRAWGYGVSDPKSDTFQVCNAPARCFAGIGGIEGTGGGQLALPEGTAVDNTAGLTHGDVYVEDPVHHRIERFGENGEFILTFGGEVNKTSKGDVCLAGEECQAGKAGAGASEFERLGRNVIAVGPTGTVYVGDIGRVQKFSAAGTPEGEITLPAGAGAVELLAVDSSGEIYVQSSELQGIRKYDGAGVEQTPVRDPEAHGSQDAITVGAGDELLVSDPRQARLLEYDAAGIQRGSFPEGEDASGGIALNDGTKTLYTLYQHPSRVLVQTLPGPGPIVLEGSEGATEVSPTSARLNATINAEGPEETSYHFEYGPSETYGNETPQTTLPGGEEEEFKDQPESAVITGLTPSTLYHFRVVVTNAAHQTTTGPDQTFQTLPPVSIDSQSATAVTATSAKLLAELNPHGLQSEYHFEYGQASSYEASAPIPDASAGDGTSDETFEVKLQDLKPHTLYHYRVVAHNALGPVQGADQTFITQSAEAPTSIDGRGDELVSPAEKHGVSLEGLTGGGGIIEAAKDGSGLAYIALGSIDAEPSGNRSSKPSQLLATRKSAGSWSTEDIATPHQAPAGLIVGSPSEYRLFSSDLSRAAVAPAGATPLSPLASEYTPYVREPGGSYNPLVYPGNVPAGTKFGGTEISPELSGGTVGFVTGTPDLAHVLVASPTSLVEGFETKGNESDYEWSEGATPDAPGTLEAVSLIPPAGGSACGGSGPACVAGSEEGIAKVGNSNEQVRSAISEDGGRVFFATTAHHGRLYLRDIARKETLRVDAAAPGVEAAEGGAKFQLANSDGSKVFFTDDQKLTEDSTAVAEEPDLYECEIVREGGKLTCHLSDLSVDEHPGEAANVQGVVLGSDESGRYVYFVAKGALTEGAAQGSCPTASEGQCVNLYEEDTVEKSGPRLVAVLSAADFPDWQAGGHEFDLGQLTARVSPHGRYLAFMSERSLTGYDNRDANSGAHDEEVFLYHAPENLTSEAGSLRCASCDPTGQRPVGVLDHSLPGPLIDRPHTWEEHWLAASIPGWVRVDEGHALHQPRYLSNAGRLFFNSAQALVPADGNGTQDVYEFEPNGTGGCSEGSGCVSLISSGSSSEESALLDASESGDDVFFLTAAQLSGADQDNAFDVYDAHVCSLAPGCAPALGGAPPPCVSTDACRAAPAAQPDSFGAPASSTFSGAGNLTPPAAAVKPKAKPLTRAQLLAKALKACKKQRSPKGRARCIERARAKYGPKHPAKAKKSSGKKKSSAKSGFAKGKS